MLDARSAAPEQALRRAHASRIRGVACIRAAAAGDGAASLAGTAASDGTLRLWDLRRLGAFTILDPTPLKASIWFLH